MKRTWRKKIGAVVALLAAVAVLGTGCGADAAGAVESRTRETRALGLLLSREDTFLSELKADIEAEAAALESGKLYMTVDQNPEAQARAAVAAAVNLARGRAYDDGLRELLGNDCTDPEQPFVLRVPVEAVTA